MYLEIQKYIEFFKIKTTIKIQNIDNYFNKIFKKNLLIIGRNSLRKKNIIFYLIQYYHRISYKKTFIQNKYSNLDFFNQLNNLNIFPTMIFFEIFLSKNTDQNFKHLEILSNKLFSEFRIINFNEKKIILLHNINFLDKNEQKKLLNIVEKYQDYFFFIFTTNQFDKIQLSLKKKLTFFSMSLWTSIVKKYFLKLYIKNKQGYDFNKYPDKKKTRNIIYKKFKNLNNKIQNVISYLENNFNYRLIVFLYKKNQYLKNCKLDILIKMGTGYRIFNISIYLYLKKFLFFNQARYFDYNKTKNLIIRSLLMYFTFFFN